MTSLKTLTELLGEHPNSPRLGSFLENVASAANITPPEPELKAYPDAVYFNYYTLGISLVFIPSSGHQTGAATYEDHALDAIDIYNSRDKGEKANYVTFPLLPLEVKSADGQLTAESTGQDIVRALGEPERKGGGGGPSSGSISIWCEWSRRGIMVEFGGEHVRGPQAWERGKDAVWQVFTLFPPKTS